MIIHELNSMKNVSSEPLNKRDSQRHLEEQLELDDKKYLLSKCRYLYENRFLNGKLLVHTLHEKKCMIFRVTFLT